MKIVTQEMLETVASRAHASSPNGVSEEAGGPIPQGSRNATLTSMAGAMRRKGFGEGAIFAALRVDNEQRCQPPLDEGEVRKIARSIATYPPGDVTQAGPTTGNHHNPDLDGPNSKLPPVPPFPLDALPSALRTLVEETARAIGCPPEFVAVPMLPTLGAAIGNSRRLQLKRGWTEGATLYVAVVADPGTKKTPASKVATRPAWDRQEEQKREYDEAKARYLHPQEEESDEEGECDEESWWKEGEVEEGPQAEPTLGRSVVDDATSEALVSLLVDNPRGLLCAKDELSGWVRGLDQYKPGRGGADRQFWLSAHTNQPVTVDRKGKEPEMVTRTFVGLTGSIQPGILPELKNGREDGLLDRFLLAYPDPVPSRWTDDEISDESINNYRELYERLCKLSIAVDENGVPAPERLEFARDAKEIFKREVNSLRKEMELPRFPDHLKGPWSKLEGYLARLSLILALVRIVGEKQEDDELDFMTAYESVESCDVKAAVKLLRYFKAHARRVYAKLRGGEKPEYLLAEALKGFLKTQGGSWEGQTSKLYGLLEARSAPGLPGGPGPFGKQIRKVATIDTDLSLISGWDDKNPIVKLSLLDARPDDKEILQTEGTEGKNESEERATGGGAAKSRETHEDRRNTDHERPDQTDDV